MIIAKKEEALDHRHCSTSSSIFPLSAYVLAKYLAYAGRALLNLSLLTGDLQAVLFSVMTEQIFPFPPLCFIASVPIMSGVAVHEIGPSPISEEHNADHRAKEIRMRNQR